MAMIRSEDLKLDGCCSECDAAISKYARSGLCRQCLKKKQGREWREKNPDYHKQWLADNPEFKKRGAARNKEWRAENRDLVYATGIRHRYHMSWDDYQFLLQAEQGKCAICGATSSGKQRKTRLLIDHCHRTDVIRGLLCDGCNRGLGFFEDDPERLGQAVAYLERNVNFRELF